MDNFRRDFFEGMPQVPARTRTHTLNALDAHFFPISFTSSLPSELRGPPRAAPPFFCNAADLSYSLSTEEFVRKGSPALFSRPVSVYPYFSSYRHATPSLPHSPSLSRSPPTHPYPNCLPTHSPDDTPATRSRRCRPTPPRRPRARPRTAPNPVSPPANPQPTRQSSCLSPPLHPPFFSLPLSVLYLSHGAARETSGDSYL